MYLKKIIYSFGSHYKRSIKYFYQKLKDYISIYDMKKILILFITLLVVSCGSSRSTTSSDSEATAESTFPTTCAEVTGTATFSEVYAIMNAVSEKGCVSTNCHGGVRTPDLSTEETAKANIVGVASIGGTRTYITGSSLDSTESFLYNKLIDPVSGVRMPNSGTEWDSDDILTIARWICEGAN
jgi:hypothetical protein